MSKEDSIVQYIIKFLLGEENAYLCDKVAYGDNAYAHLVIIPSGFFDEGIYMTESSMPQIPLKEIEGVPLLYGESTFFQTKTQLVVQADIIASTFFLITRYEEYLNNKNRDEYGRFMGKGSLMGRTGGVMRPVVDEYGVLMREWLRRTGADVAEPVKMFKHVYLSHDVDEIWQWNSLYRALRTTLRKIIQKENNLFESIKAWSDYKKYDKVYTFPWMTEMDTKVIKKMGTSICTSVYFLKGGGEDSADNGYYKRKKRVRNLVYYLKKRKAVFGLHASLTAGKEPERIFEEKKYLEEILGEEIRWNRNHYLCSKNPEDMEYLIMAGITDDFTMAYADTVGFRLGTCRPVRWINPKSKEITSLTMHPLTIMECTLDAKKYMNLSETEANKVIYQMLNTVKYYNGEAVLLWHNTSVAVSNTGYQRSCYKKTLEIIANLIDMEGYRSQEHERVERYD